MAEPVRVAAVVPWEKCVEFAVKAYEAAGMPPDQARDAGTAIVDADGHGTTTHGLKNLRGYITEITSGRFNAEAEHPGGRRPQGIGDHRRRQRPGPRGGGVRHAQGDRAGQRVLRSAARSSASSNHYGHSGYWASMAVRHNMVGFAITNASAGIAPFGGKVGLIGNNPPSWAHPDAGGRPEQHTAGLGVSAGLPGHGAERGGRQPPGHLPPARRAAARRAGRSTRTASRPTTPWRAEPRRLDHGAWPATRAPAWRWSCR